MSPFLTRKANVLKTIPIASPAKMIFEFVALPLLKVIIATKSPVETAIPITTAMNFR